MDKKTLDTWGGVGSVSTGAFCVWLALAHDPHDRMYTVWLIACAVLVLNGIAMLIYAQRSKPSGGTGRQVRH